MAEPTDKSTPRFQGFYEPPAPPVILSYCYFATLAFGYAANIMVFWYFTELWLLALGRGATNAQNVSGRHTQEGRNQFSFLYGAKQLVHRTDS
ncbi:hypothetical protein NUU61_003348 [Penicillium alfredii]|uniref:Uncharacterized protein n=1 Tax=Penicillium alfredii TaxID=1506179 RepID=A0A9W9FT62_9EURO|nr:uncharacterized protein NUU61_003348 [Penicillium alfredii]KAJ5106001.1 hypothetical protein NUU61_003348 [Penicillium alfredii]